MNANELADKQAFEQGELSMWIRNETATMLRQQHEQIEALKAENKFFKDLMGDVEILVKAQEK